MLAPPFVEQWHIHRGGVTKNDSHSWRVIGQRFAYDFVVRKAGSTHRHRGHRLEDYHAFGRPVVAPADGRVIAAVDRHRDHPRPGTGWIDWRATDIRGNHIVLKHAMGGFSLIAHLRLGSCRVKPGDRVCRGDVLGECGNSGHSTEPHIHFHVQDRASFYGALGRPVWFSRVRVEHADATPFADWLCTGDIVTPLPADADHPVVSQSPPPPQGAILHLGDAFASLVAVAGNLGFVYVVVDLWMELMRWTLRFF
jgi:murein DD-endopeptidase MepM/ murein hydrolase activator NlpD